MAAVATRGRVYGIGGIGGPGGETLSDVVSLDPREGKWRAEPSMLATRGQCAAAVLGGRIFAGWESFPGRAETRRLASLYACAAGCPPRTRVPRPRSSPMSMHKRIPLPPSPQGAVSTGATRASAPPLGLDCSGPSRASTRGAPSPPRAAIRPCSQEHRRKSYDFRRFFVTNVALGICRAQRSRGLRPSGARGRVDPRAPPPYEVDTTRPSPRTNRTRRVPLAGCRCSGGCPRRAWTWPEAGTPWWRAAGCSSLSAAWALRSWPHTRVWGPLISVPRPARRRGSRARPPWAVESLRPFAGGVWQPEPCMTQARTGVCAVSVHGAVHAFGGAGMAGGALSSGEFFVPGTGKVRPTDAAAPAQAAQADTFPAARSPGGRCQTCRTRASAPLPPCCTPLVPERRGLRSARPMPGRRDARIQ